VVCPGLDVGSDQGKAKRPGNGRRSKTKHHARLGKKRRSTRRKKEEEEEEEEKEEQEKEEEEEEEKRRGKGNIGNASWLFVFGFSAGPIN